MRQKVRKLCADAAVKRGAENHQFLCAKLRMPWKCPKRVVRKKTRRFDVSGMVQVSGKGEEALGPTKQEYVELCWREQIEIGPMKERQKRSGKW